jgi:hypothetical protein
MRSPVPRVSPLNPQIAILLTLQRCGFCRIATVSDSFHDRRPGRVAIPTESPTFVLLSEDFVRLTASGQFCGFRRVDISVGNQCLLGNCVQLELKAGSSF